MQKPKFFKMTGLTSKEVSNTLWLTKIEVCRLCKCGGRKLDSLVESGLVPIPYMGADNKLYWREQQLLEKLNQQEATIGK